MDSRESKKLIDTLKDLCWSVNNLTEVVRAGQRQPDPSEPPLEEDILPCSVTSEQRIEDAVVERLINIGVLPRETVEEPEPIFDGYVPVYVDFETPILGKALAFFDEKADVIRLEIQLPRELSKNLDDLMGPHSTRALTFVPNAANPKRENN
jgi:hypothetical protein